MNFFKNQKRFLLIIFSVFLGITLFSYLFFFRNRYRQNQGGEFYELNPATNQFVKLTSGKPSEPEISQFGPAQPDGSTFITKILKGYFHNFNKNSNELMLKNEFFRSTTLQLVTASTENLDQFYCWPEEVASQNGSLRVKTMEFFIYPDGRDILMPGEVAHPMDQLEKTLKENHYLVIQLKDSFHLQSDNIVQKLILLGC